MDHIGPYALILAVRNILPERSGKFLLEDREKRFGIDLESLSNLKGEEAFKAGEGPGGAFEQLKDAAHEYAVLKNIDVEKPARLEVDASKFSVGAVLLQKENGKWMPCSFYSYKLSAAEQKYHVGEKEFLGLIKAIKHWKLFLSGPFIARTDHQNIVHYMKQPEIENARIARWVMFLQDYNIVVKYIPGMKNVIAASISREGVCNLMFGGPESAGQDLYKRIVDSYTVDKEMRAGVILPKKEL